MMLNSNENTLFELKQELNAPLAERMRPKSIEEVRGQEHLIGSDGPLFHFFQSGSFPSIIFWGPPGVGKTTFAFLIAQKINYNFTRISAIESGVKEVREIIETAKKNRKLGRKSLLFIDEIHRFNKSQQDALLHAVENGILTLIGATTENPSFEVIPALLSRCRVYHLHHLSEKNISEMVQYAIEKDVILSKFKISFESLDFLIQISGGDARTALNALEHSFLFAKRDNSDEIYISRDILQKTLQQKIAFYDKNGENHYDTISAFIKSMRGSDPDAALFWLTKMLEAGEDPIFIARRMVVFASEDIGNANPQALQIAVAVFQAVQFIGMPEAAINLGQGVSFLASSEKSNASYQALFAAWDDIKNGIDNTVPLHLRNAPTKLMKQEGYGKEYKYPHSFYGHFVVENYFPDSIKQKQYYYPSSNGDEKIIKERLKQFWTHKKYD